MFKMLKITLNKMYLVLGRSVYRVGEEGSRHIVLYCMGDFMDPKQKNSERW